MNPFGHDISHASATPETLVVAPLNSANEGQEQRKRILSAKFNMGLARHMPFAIEWNVYGSMVNFIIYRRAI